MSEPLNVRKIAYTMPVSFETLLSAGAITEEQAREMGWTPPPPISRRRRLRWAWQDWRYRHTPHIHLGPCNHEDCA